MKFERFAEKYIEPGFSREIYPNNQLDLDGSKYRKINSENSELENMHIDDNIKLRTIMPLKEGMELHSKITKGEPDEKIKREKAWNCFCDNAEMGNSIAKYWKGLYLLEGHISKDLKKAIQLFKEAADDNFPLAQLRYAFTLVPNISKSKQIQKEFIKYLTMAADNENSVALYNLGDLYLNGKCGVQKNRDLGIKKLRLAASLGNKDAINMLENIGILKEE